MATDTRVSITVDTGNAESGLNRLRSAFGQLGSSTTTTQTDLSRFENAIQQLAASFNRFENEMRGIQTALTTLANRFSTLIGDVNRLGAATNGTINNFNNINRTINNTTNNTNHYSNAVNNVTNNTNHLNRTINNTTNNYNRLGDTVNNNTTIINNYGSAANRAARATTKLDEALDGMKTLGAAAGIALGAIGFAVKGTVDEAIKFEASMADVKKVVNFDSPKGFQDMRQDLLDLSTQVPIAADGLAQIAAAAGQSGIAAGEIMVFTQAAAKMGTAFDISAEQAGQAMAEMRTAFKMSQTDVETLADKINYLGNNSPNAAAKIMQIVQTVGPLGELAGVSAAQIAAMGASINSLAPEVVATGLKNMFLALTKGEGASKGAKDAFESLGLSSAEMAKKMQVDSTGAINEVIGALKKLPKEAQVSAVNSIFGAEALPVVAQMITGTDTLNKNLRDMGDSSKYAGSMNAEAASKASTTANQIKLLSNNMKTAKIAIGDALLPAINQLAQAVIPVIQQFTAWAKANPDLIVNIIGLSASILGVITVLGGIALAITAVAAGWGALTAIGTGLAAVFTFLAAPAAALAAAMAVLTSPITAIVIGIGILIAAGALLYQNWDMISAKASEVWAAVGEIVAIAVDNVKAKWDELKQGASDIWNGILEAAANIQAAWTGFTAFFSGLWGGIVPIAASAWTGVSSAISSAWSSITSVISGAVETVKSVASAGFSVISTIAQVQFSLLKSVVSTAWSAIKGLFSAGVATIKAVFTAGVTVLASIFNGVFNTIKAIVSTAFNVIKALATGNMAAVKAAFVNGFNQVVSAVKTMGSDILNAFKTLGSQMLAIGGDIIQGLINGIKARAGAVVAEAQRIASSISSTIKSALDIHSPSRVTTALGEHAGQGLANGLKNKQSEVAKQAAELAKQVTDNIASLQKEVTLFGKDSPVASFDYDVSNGKFAGVSSTLIANNRALLVQLEAMKANDKERVDLANQYKQAQDSVNTSVADMAKQIALFGNESPLASFVYDMQNSEKYLGASAESLTALVAKYKELDVLKKTQESGKAFDDLKNANDQAQESPAQKMAREYQEKLAVIANYEQLHTDKVAEAAALRDNVNNQYAQASRDTMMDNYQTLFGGLADLTQSFAGKQAGIYKGMIVAQRAVATAQAGINMWKAASSAYADTAGSVWQKAAAAAMAVTKGGQFMAMIQAIKPPTIGQAHDGIMSVPKSGTWNLEKGERVLPSKTAAAMDKKLANSGNGGVQVNNYAGVKVETRQENGLTIFDIKNVVDEHMRSQMTNPNSTVSKSIYRNTNARPQR